MHLHTYKNIKIEPFEISRIMKLKIVKKPNEHTKITFTGILKKGIDTQYIKNFEEQESIKVTVNTETESNKVIFSGIIETIGIVKDSNGYKIKVKAVSHSKRLDIKLINNSYQNFDMTYNDLMKKAAEKQNGSIKEDNATNGKKTGKFIIQYNETTWEFLKRMASELNAPLIVDDKSDVPSVCIGKPKFQNSDVGLLNDYNFLAEKRIGNYRETSEKYNNKDADEIDYVTYKIYSEKIFEIGEKADFKNKDNKIKDLYIKEAIINMEDGILKNTYYLMSEKGFYVNTIKNDSISGVSLTGTVVEVNSDNVKVDLDIDVSEKFDKEKSCEFKFSTFYTSDNGGGFYCMPEIGEKVSLYFPDEEENNAFVQNAVRTDFKADGDRGDPDIKFFRTKDGKEIMFTPDGIQIRCIDNEIFINLTEKEGIYLSSSKPINLCADKGAAINIEAEGAVKITADEEIDLKSNGSNINMKSGTTKIKGSNIKVN